MKKRLTKLLLVFFCMCFWLCGGCNNISNNETDNTPIELTVDNIEEYVIIEFTLRDFNESKTQRYSNAYYYHYEYDIEVVVRPRQGYYFENVDLEIDFETIGKDYDTSSFGFQRKPGPYVVSLDYNGNGSYVGMHSYNYSERRHDRSFFYVEEFTVKSVTGSVYKSNPNN